MMTIKNQPRMVTMATATGRLPRPSNSAAEGYRILWTLCGAGIGVLVTLLGDLLGRRKARPQPAARPA
jgi:hypothetical protein